MLKLEGIVTNHGSFTPSPTPENPQPPTFHTLEIDGLPVSVPPSFNRSAYPPIGASASCMVTHQKMANGGYKFKLVSLSPAAAAR